MTLLPLQVRVTGRRVYVRLLWRQPCRLHHGMDGLLLAVVGAVLMWHDRRDFPWIYDR